MTGLYSSNFVVNILVNDKMQEIAKDGTITVPFDSEYSIRLQNKHDRRAVAKIFIDDENVSSGGIVINARSHVTVERPVSKATKFKFVALTSEEAAEAGKTVNKNGEKGTIRVEFQLEKKIEYVQPIYPYHYNYDSSPWKRRGPYPDGPEKFRKYLGAMPATRDCPPESFCESEVKTSGGIKLPPQVPHNYDGSNGGVNRARKIKADYGCTVDGSHSDQSFTSIYIDLESGPPVIITVVLRGYDESTLPLFDGKSNYCTKCGKKASRKTDKFCSRCGTRLE